ncbi:hypothetical protein [Pseudoroseomonas ludipueritiae]|uniref:Uncharacterized protein n=1 Tax=Pseudoroseomonas ludipueritiae TaxID=198093 RepID=A0ABR7R2P2_9PROT|nr:hypothetical protein [Pseudoroseomonas ludipueritiae]MBC9175890.1 hypothetical protein [Pseudoroseomonas ludipueritiae]
MDAAISGERRRDGYEQGLQPGPIAHGCRELFGQKMRHIVIDKKQK